MKIEDVVFGEKVRAVFAEHLADELASDIALPSSFMKKAWAKYPQGEKGMNGRVFEALLSVLFVRRGLQPLFAQAKLAFIPNVEFDFVLYSTEYGPIVLSAKTSLRERYKQADLEGMMLRQVHRNSQSFLITLNEKEANSVNAKIGSGEVLGLDKVVRADSNSFDELIAHLETLTFFKPPAIDVITSKHILAT